jgi:hypothetical protein
MLAYHHLCCGGGTMAMLSRDCSLSAATVSYTACVNRLCVQLESLQPGCNCVCFVFEEHELRALVDAAGHLLSRLLPHAQEGKHLCAVNRCAMMAYGTRHCVRHR